MRNFNLDDFKKWIDEHEEEDKSREKEFSKGDVVKSSIPFKKLVNRISEENGDRKSICKEFYTDGGTIIGAVENSLVIEVDSGTFSINKSYVELS